MAKTPRGIRNFNPGNLRKSSDKWQGLAKNQNDSAFFTYQSMAYGVRAAAITLINYQDKYGLATVQGIIDRWAPPVENNTRAYVDSVCKRINRSPDERINLHEYHTLRGICEAIFIHENGQPVAGADIDRGLLLAGVAPPPRDLKKSRTVHGGTFAAVGGMAGTAKMIGDQAKDAITTWGDLAPWFIGLAILGGIGYMLWARIDDRRRGWR